MKRLLTTAFLLTAVVSGSTTLLFGAPAQACEKHLHGHQTNSDTNSEATQK